MDFLIGIDRYAQRIADVYERGLSWEFDLVAFWEKDGKVYGAHDSGCSCPGEFEWVSSLNDLVEIRSIDDARRLIEEHGYHLDDKRHALEKLAPYLMPS